MSSCGRTFSKRDSFEDHAVLTIEEIQNVVGEKVGEDLDCVDWHFSTENFKSFCPLGHRPVSGGEDAEIKVASTVSSETAKVLQKWMDLNDSGVSSRASGTMCVRRPSGKLKYQLSLKHILPLSASFEDRRDDTSRVDVFMTLSCASFYLEEPHESTTPLFVWRTKTTSRTKFFTRCSRPLRMQSFDGMKCLTSEHQFLNCVSVPMIWIKRVGLKPTQNKIMIQDHGLYPVALLLPTKEDI